MIKICFASKDYSIVHYTLINKYSRYQFLYINAPKLEDKETYLLFKYIGDKDKFDEAISLLRQNGVEVLVENDED